MLRFSHLRGAGGEGAVDGQGADRELIAVAGDHQRLDVAHEVRRVGRNRRAEIELRR